jgi:hypothetical protein
VPPSIVSGIADAVSSGYVTVSSRSMAGRVEARYGYDGGGYLKNSAMLAGDLSASRRASCKWLRSDSIPAATAVGLIRHFADCD